MNVVKKDKAKQELKKSGVSRESKERAEIGKHARNSKMIVYLAGLIVLAGIVGYYFLLARNEVTQSSNMFMALGSLSAGFLAGGALFFLSETGRNLIRFFKEARIELRKVFWPSMDETKKMTILVIIVMLVVMIFLMFVDWGLKSIISFILNFA